MKTFPGFPSKPDYVGIPKLFFSDVLPFIQDIAELMVTLQLFRLLGARRGYPRVIAAHELLEDRFLVAGFTQLGRDFREEIPRGLAAALARGTFLQATSPTGQTGVLLNSPQEHRAVAAIRRGEVPLAGAAPGTAPVPLPKGDIFTLYEETIGPFSPLIAEQLQEAEREYPEQWLQEAFLIASEQNVRKWSYVEAILRRWRAEGKDDGTPRGHHAARPVADYSSWLPPRRTKG